MHTDQDQGRMGSGSKAKTGDETAVNAYRTLETIMNIKVNLKPGQKYIGPKGKGEMQAALVNMVAMILSDLLVVPEKDNPEERFSVTFRVDDNTYEQLSEIAEKNEVSLQELLRLGMEQLRLVTRP